MGPCTAQQPPPPSWVAGERSRTWPGPSPTLTPTRRRCCTAPTLWPSPDQEKLRGSVQLPPGVAPTTNSTLFICICHIITVGEHIEQTSQDIGMFLASIGGAVICAFGISGCCWCRLPVCTLALYSGKGLVWYIFCGSWNVIFRLSTDWMEVARDSETL